MRFRLPRPKTVPSEPESDTARLRAALVCSTALHVGLAVLLLAGGWWMRRSPEDAQVFTLVAPPDAAGPPDPAGESAATDFLAAMRQRQRAEERRAQREIAQERRREDRARAAAEAAAEAERRTRERQASARAPARVVAPTNPRATSSAAEAGVMDAYFATLITRLRETHEAPSGLSDQLSAEVRFTLGADGSVTGVRITRGSGNAAFDQSVLDAFSRLRLPSRPDGKTDEVRLTFRIREL